MALRIFFSYSHDDEEYRNQLEKHLALLKKQSFIETWHDRRLVAGDVIDDGVDVEINRADVILLLVSASFISSDYCFSREMARAMERHDRKEARVVPVIVRDCDWHSAPFGKLKAIPRDGKAIASWANFDAAYTDVAREIRAIAEASAGSASRRAPQEARAVGAPAQPANALPRSGNLRVKQEFSDLDKSRFLRDTFDFVARYFEGSMEELSNRNSDIDVSFRRVDADSFTAEIFRNGKRASQCAVRLGGGGFRDTGITYSNDPSRAGSSFNERVSVDNDDQSMFLRSMGMSRVTTGGAQDEKLSAEGVAELFWEMLLRALQ